MKKLQALLSFLLLIVATGTATGDTILDTSDGAFSVTQAAPADGAFLADTSNFNITLADIPNIELSVDFDIVDAGIEILVNGTRLFPQFFDISEFGPTQVFGGTNIAGGGVENPFTANSNGLPRVRIEASSAGVVFTGAETTSTGSLISYIPQFETEDFTNLLIEGDNEIQFFVLNNFDGANIVGTFEVTQVTPVSSVPEPSTAGIVLLTLLTGLTYRRRS